MRIVLDTNVLVSAFISHGRCADVLEHCSAQHVLVTSPQLVSELRDKLIHKFGMGEASVERAETLVLSGFVLVNPSPLPVPICRDPDDDMVLATALSGLCEVIVTGDRDLLVLESHAGVRIITPGDRLEHPNG